MDQQGKSSDEQVVRSDDGPAHIQEQGPWVKRRGFAALVAVGALCAAYAAWKVHVPDPVPDFALQAEAVYRIEVAAATFLGLYLMMMAFVLALHNRGFSEIGMNGLKAQDMANWAQQEAIQGQEDTLRALQEMLVEMGESTEATAEDLRARALKLGAR